MLSLKKEQLTLENDLAKILVEQNLITQAQADAIKTNVDAAVAALTTSDSANVLGKGDMDRLDILQGITLTDTQKAAILEWAAKSAAVQKKIVSLYKDAGVITQTQADAMNTQIDNQAANPLNFSKMGDGKMSGGHKGHGRSFDNDPTQTDSTSTAS